MMLGRDGAIWAETWFCALSEEDANGMGVA